MKPTIAITIIGHNEADHLRELLPRLRWADEVIYVDCSSSDDSLDIARDMGCKTFVRPNLSNLNVNKAFAIEQATADWIFYLDPDERIPEPLQQEILETIAAPGDFVAFRVNRRNFYFGRWLRHGSQYPDTQLRLFKRGKARFPQRHVHEKLAVDGPIGKLKQDMHHYPYLTVEQYLQKFNFYTTFEARYMWENGMRPSLWNGWRFLFWKPLSRFFRRYFLKRGFLDGLPGLFAAQFDALNFVVRYMKLWDINRREHHA